MATDPKEPRSELHAIVAGARDLEAVTRAKYLRDLDAWIDFAGADPKNWTNDTADRFYAQLLKRVRPQTANRILSAVRYAAKWRAERAGNPSLHFARIPTQKPRNADRQDRGRLTQEETILLLHACAGPHPHDKRDFALVVVGLETGMRRMSLAAMKSEGYSDVDGYPSTAVPIKGSGGDLYHVPLSDLALAALQPWQDWLHTQRRLAGPIFKRVERRLTPIKGQTMPHGEFFAEKEGISETMIHKIVATRAQKAGIHTDARHVHPHLFRHTFVATRMDAGVSPTVIAAMTGHHLRELGAMASYVDRKSLGNIARTTTPLWLADTVKELIR